MVDVASMYFMELKINDFHFLGNNCLLFDGNGRIKSN